MQILIVWQGKKFPNQTLFYNKHCNIKATALSYHQGIIRDKINYLSSDYLREQYN